MKRFNNKEKELMQGQINFVLYESAPSSEIEYEGVRDIEKISSKVSTGKDLTKEDLFFLATAMDFKKNKEKEDIDLYNKIDIIIEKIFDEENEEKAIKELDKIHNEKRNI